MNKMEETKKNQRVPFLESGILLVDKPLEWTSHDVVAFIKGRFNISKIGHAGTLDPAATGLLVVLINKATKLSEQLTGHDKVYEAELLLGQETDSYDMEGIVTSSKGCEGVSLENISSVLSIYKGEMLQIPPMFSAKKVNGKKLYELARDGKEIKRDPVSIKINSLKVIEFNSPYLSILVDCSKGTYIRTLAYDIGKDLLCGATLSKLRRIKSGNFDLKNAVNITSLRSFAQDELKSVMIDING